MSVVIVDDSPTNLIVLKHLAKSQLEGPIQTFSLPERARDYLSCNEALIIIADCEMPDLDGITFIRQVRAFRHHRDTPIIMVTNHKDDAIRRLALDAGANAFLSKPVVAAEFKEKITLLSKKVARV